MQRYAHGELDTVAEVDTHAVLAVSDPRGGILVQSRRPPTILHVAEDERTVVKRNATLHDAILNDRSPIMAYTTCVRRPQREPEGYVYVMDLETRVSRRVTDACMVEFGVSRVSVRSNVVVTTASSDLTEVFGFFRPDGTELTDRPNPSDDLPYNEPPRLLEAVLSPDARTLAYLEGPDPTGRSGDGQTLVGEWALVVQDQTTSKETFRLKLAPPADDVGFVRLDFDGRWAVLSEPGDRPVSVIDTEAAAPSEIELRDVHGVASFEAH